MTVTPTGHESPKEPDRSSLLATLVPLGAVAAGLLTALVVFAGWQYTTEYYKQFGIDPGALNFSPYNYALNSYRLVTVVAGIASWLIAATWFRAHTSITRVANRNVSFLVMGLSVTMPFLWFLGFVTNQLTIQLIGIFATGMSAAFLVAFGTRGDAMAVSLLLAVSLSGYALFGAARLGSHDGEADRHDLKTFPAVSVVTKSDLRLEDEVVPAGPPVYGPYRLILYNAGMYYMVSENAPDKTIAVPADAILHLELRHAD